jgi:hypothetical protein
MCDLTIPLLTQKGPVDDSGGKLCRPKLTQKGRLLETKILQYQASSSSCYKNRHTAREHKLQRPLSHTWFDFDSLAY